MTSRRIEWKDSFKVGIASIDHEHRELIELINGILERLQADPSDPVVEAGLGEILAQISSHFALEETEMRAAGYDRYREHKQAHESLLDQLRDIMDSHDAGQSGGLGERLADCLSDWFSEHFRTEDARLHGALHSGT